MALIATEYDFGLKLQIKLLSFPDGNLAESANLVYYEESLNEPELGSFKGKSKSIKIYKDESNEDEEYAFYSLKDQTGNQIQLCKLIKPHIEMSVLANYRTTVLKSNIIRLTKLPTITARMSRTKRNTIVLDWDLAEIMTCIKVIRVYEKIDNKSMSSFLFKSSPNYKYLTNALLDPSSTGRFVLDEDVEIRALSDRLFLVEAELADGRKTSMVRLEAAPEMLLKARVDEYGKYLHVELIGEEDLELVDESDNYCNRLNFCSLAACWDFVGLGQHTGSLPEIKSTSARLDRLDGHIQEYSSGGSLRLPPTIHLVQHNGHGGKSVIKINREPKLVNKYKLVDRNGVQIPFTTTTSSFVEAKLTDGITYASSDAIEVTPPPNPPEMDISTSLRNPKNPNILIEAHSQDAWSHIAMVDLYYESAIWSRSSSVIHLESDKKHPSYTTKRRFKLPTDMNLHGVDFELVFILADGREWFRKAEVKPLTIENKLQGLINVLKLLNVIKDQDLLWIRQFLLLIYRWRVIVISVLSFALFQLVLSLPIVGTLLSSGRTN